MKCAKCGNDIGFLQILRIDNKSLCKSCYEKSAIEKELPAGFNSEEKRIKQLALRSTKLYEYKNIDIVSAKFYKVLQKLQKELDTSIKENQTENILQPDNTSDTCFVCLKLIKGVKYFVANKTFTICKECIQKVRESADKLDKKYKFDIEKVNKLLLRKKIKEKVEGLVQEKIQRIKEAELERKIQEEAERRFYGKVKTKRENIPESDKQVIFNKFDNKCFLCGATEGLHIHHKDKNPKNNEISNLVVLCGVCHKKIHMKVR